MKTRTLLLIVTIAVDALGFGTASVLAQATFYFYNGGVVDAPVYDAAGVRLQGSSYLAMLYGGDSVDALVPARNGSSSETMAAVPFLVTYLGQPGYFAGSGYVTVGLVPPGGPAWLEVRAWDVRLGPTYEDVVSLGLGAYGASPPFQKTGGNPTLGVTTPPETLIGLQSFSLVPEPGPVVVLLLGLSGLLLFPRQRRRGFSPTMSPPTSGNGR
jgi:hypothetical protein